MLILTRKPGQRIQIGPDITVVVWPDGKGRVKVGVQAPDHVAIQRAEMDEELPDESDESAQR